MMRSQIVAHTRFDALPQKVREREAGSLDGSEVRGVKKS